ncbi:MAG: methyltransferase [Cypionkella sp.]|nr:methyltransferase [Cypionkella sp.]
MALRSGVLAQPLGDVAVFAPQIGDDLSALPRARCTIVTGFKPDFDHFAAQGFTVVAALDAATKVDLAIVCLPRAKAAARDLLAQASATLRAGGRIAIDGQKTDGIEAVLRDIANLGTDLDEVVSKAHGKLAVFVPPPSMAAWAAAPQMVEGDFITRAGVFSADGPDRASMLLAAALPAKLPARVADFGGRLGLFGTRNFVARRRAKP